MVSKDKNYFIRDVSLVLKVWRTGWIHITLLVVSLSLGWENRAKLWVGLLTVMVLSHPPCPSLCWGHFPAQAGAGSIFWNIGLVPMGTEVTDLEKGACDCPSLSSIFSRQAKNRVWSEAVCTYLIFWKNFNLVYFFSLSFAVWLMALFLVFFSFCFYVT